MSFIKTLKYEEVYRNEYVDLAGVGAQVRPCRALSSAQPQPQRKTTNSSRNDSSLNGGYPLTACLTPGVHFRVIPPPTRSN